MRFSGGCTTPLFYLQNLNAPLRDFQRDALKNSFCFLKQGDVLATAVHFSGGCTTPDDKVASRMLRGWGSTKAGPTTKTVYKTVCY